MNHEHGNRSIERRLDGIESKLDRILHNQLHSADQVDKNTDQLEKIMATGKDVLDAQAAELEALNKLIASNDKTHQDLADLKAQIEAGTAATAEQVQQILDNSKAMTDLANADVAKDDPPPPPAA